MPSRRSGIGLAVGVALTLAMIGLGIALSRWPATSSAQVSSIAVMAVDVDTIDNTATSLGSLQSCREVPPNQSLDIDVILDSIPIDRPMQGFEFDLIYDPAKLEVTAVDDTLLLAANPGSGPFFSFTDSVPDSDGSFKVANSDFGADPGETGSGVLARITLEVLENAAAGDAALDLQVIGVLDSDVADVPRDQELSGRLAIDSPCEAPADTDGDGISDSADNCPSHPNPDQTDIDDDGVGDGCDNCLFSANADQADFDTDGLGDVCDDSDSDGFSDFIELYVGTDPLTPCGVAAWPPDFNDDGRVSISDVLAFKPAFNTNVGDPNYDRRLDLTANDQITVSDVLVLKPLFIQECPAPTPSP